MEPTDLSPLLDLIQQSKPTSVPKWSAQGTTPNYQAASQVAALDAWGLPIAGAKPERGPKKNCSSTGAKPERGPKKAAAPTGAKPERGAQESCSSHRYPFPLPRFPPPHHSLSPSPARRQAREGAKKAAAPTGAKPERGPKKAAAPTGAKPERGPKKTAAPTGPPSWMSMWAPAAAWSVEAPSSALLERQMGPLVSKIVVHRVLGTVACQLEPSYLVQTTPALLDQTMGALTDQSEPHFFGWQGGQASIMHSPLSAWKPDVVSDRLALPCHLYYSSSGMVWKHSLATQKASPLLTLPSEASGGNVRHTGLWTAGNSSPPISSGELLPSVVVQKRFTDTSTDTHTNTFKDGCGPLAMDSPPPIDSGEFLPSVVVQRRFTDTYTSTHGCGPLAVDSAPPISSGELFPSVVVQRRQDMEDEDNMSKGPRQDMEDEDNMSKGPRQALDMEDEDNKPKGPRRGLGVIDMEDEDNKPKGPRRGLGVIVWQSADGHLVCAGMPFARSKSAPKAEGEEEEEEEGPMGVGQHMGKVAWQSLSTYDPVLPGDAVGAVLTCQRIMMVTADLRLHVSVSIRHGSPSALSHPVTSLLWVGPVLLYLTASGIS
eukprot:gene21106-27994_t